MSLPVVEYLKIPENGEPYLEGHKCGNCSTIFVGARNVCSKCSARDKMEQIKLGTKGKLYSYSIVFRSFPGIDVPYISAIVDLDEGLGIWVYAEEGYPANLEIEFVSSLASTDILLNFNYGLKAK